MPIEKPFQLFFGFFIGQRALREITPYVGITVKSK
jgi:hypothetical protein